MKWLVRVYAGIAGVAAVVAIVGLFLPARAQLEHTIRIERPAATIYTLLARPSVYPQWATWARRDPDLAWTFSGPDVGEGARLAWVSADPEVGSGAMIVTAAQPFARVELLTAPAGWGRARSVFEIAPRGDASEVTWRAETDYGMNLVRRYRGLTLAGRLGPEMEAGLAAFRTLVEDAPPADFSDLDIEIVETTARPVAFAAERVRGDAAARQAAANAALARVRAFMDQQGLIEDGPPRLVTVRWEPPLWEFRAAVPYAGPARVATPGAALGFDQTWEGRAIRAVSGDIVGEAAVLYAKIDAFRAAHGLTQAGARWRVPRRDDDAPGSAGGTEVFLPVR